MSKLFLVLIHLNYTLITCLNVDIALAWGLVSALFPVPTDSVSSPQMSPALRSGCALLQVTEHCIQHCGFLILFLFWAVYCSRRLHFTSGFLLILRGEVANNHSSGPRTAPSATQKRWTPAPQWHDPETACHRTTTGVCDKDSLTQHSPPRLNSLLTYLLDHLSICLDLDLTCHFLLWLSSVNLSPQSRTLKLHSQTGF